MLEMVFAGSVYMVPRAGPERTPFFAARALFRHSGGERASFQRGKYFLNEHALSFRVSYWEDRRENLGYY